MDIQQLGLHSLGAKGYNQLWGFGHTLGGTFLAVKSLTKTQEASQSSSTLMAMSSKRRASLSNTAWAEFQAWSGRLPRMVHTKVMQARGCWSNLNSNVYVAGEPAP